MGDETRHALARLQRELKALEERISRLEFKEIIYCFACGQPYPHRGLIGGSCPHCGSRPGMVTGLAHLIRQRDREQEDATQAAAPTTDETERKER